MLPAAASLQKQGANKGAVASFLVSTPESGVDSIAVTYALLDPIMTVIRPVGAFLSAMAVGFAENIVSYKEKEHKVFSSVLPMTNNCCGGEGFHIEERSKINHLYQKVTEAVRYGLIDVWGDIVLWFFAGLLLAGVITALVPESFMENWLSGGISSMIIMLFFGIPFYICATSSTPIAAALILKGVSPGAALVFLLVGPATNITSFSVLIKILGKWGSVRYIFLLSIMAVFLGIFVDFLYIASGISAQAIIGSATDVVPFSIKISATVLLILFSIKPFFFWLKKFFSKYL